MFHTDHSPTSLFHVRRWGADPDIGDNWRFAIWAPDAEHVAVRIAGADYYLVAEEGGYWRGEAVARAGEAYSFVINGAERPDPMSRAQHADVHGPSVLVDPRLHQWKTVWRGRPWHEAVIYELHIGTFTDAGTFAAAIDRLDDLVSLGFTAIEIMPVSHFDGQRGWGYDGVLPCAPHPAYGSPDDLKALVEAAQSRGLMVILDLVMNHFGPSGNYLPSYASGFFDETKPTPWGAAIDFGREQVWDFWQDVVLTWLTEYRLDGIRFDAAHEVDDDLLINLAAQIRKVDHGREIHLILEDERNLPDLRDATFDAEWNDDYHHAIHVALTGESHGYYENFAVDPIGDLCTALRCGQVEHGQERATEPRGAPVDHLPPTAFINSNQTHDQIGNRALGERLVTLADPTAALVAHGLLLTLPFIPMLFMGEEEGSTAPFLFFCDFDGDLGASIREGRSKELAAIGIDADDLPDCTSPEAFEASKPFSTPNPDRRQWRDLTRTCLAWRKENVVPLLASGTPTVNVHRLGPGSLMARWRFPAGDLNLTLNLGAHEPAVVTGDLVIGKPGTPYCFGISRSQ